jgi:hypothetical protein
MPDYLITIHLKTGGKKQGIRRHPAYDADQVRALVEKKTYATIGKASVDWIEVVPTARTTGRRIETKNL